MPDGGASAPSTDAGTSATDDVRPTETSPASVEDGVATVEDGVATVEDGVAAVEDGVAEAQALFRRGLELGEENRWADALEHFRRSLARVARPSTLFNIGVALGRLGRYGEAHYIAVSARDEVFVADTLNWRVQKYVKSR